MDGPAEKREGGCGEHGRERLALARRELSDPAVGHGQSGDELDVVSGQARRPA
jgi:hypothetical protein